MRARNEGRGKTESLRSQFLLELYLDHLVLEKGLSPNSIQAYTRDVRDFLEYVRGRGIHDASRIERETVIGYMYSLKDRGISAGSIRRKLSSLRGYFSFLIQEAVTGANPTDLIDAPNTWKRLPSTLNVNEAFALMDSVQGENRGSMRDKAMLETLYSTGMRVSELTGLRLSDLYLETCCIRVMGKGSKERIVPLGDTARNALEKYLSRARPLLDRGNGAAHVFLNMRGKPLTRMGVWKILKKYLLQCGLEAKASPHTLRHSCASHLLVGGADLRVVQEILGHSDISTTQIYLHTSREALKEVHRKFHPRG